MSEAGRAHALRLSLGARAKELVTRALDGPRDL
jgi:hypothetical protein